MSIGKLRKLTTRCCHPELNVILNLFQDLSQAHLGLMDSGSAAGMTEGGNGMKITGGKWGK
jgi:hypothetical protein